MSQVKAAARELIRRMRCQLSLHSFALNVTVPTAPEPALKPDEDLLGPASELMPTHLAAIYGVLQRAMNKPFGRFLIMAPPGSVKSLATVVACAWEMGRKPGSRIIYTSFSSEVAERQARRAMQIIRDEEYRLIWPNNPTLVRDAAGDFITSTGSNMLAMGLMAGLTSNRATGFIVDDPLAGREEADSELQRKRIRAAYFDDLLTRTLPGAWGGIIMTRWHEADLAADAVLPDDYDGRSGIFTGKDGLEWEVLCIPAKAEREDDPLGRKVGEYLWREWWPEKHWQMYEHATGADAARTWASLYQQRPTPQGSGRLDEKAIDYYKPGTQPPIMAFIGAGDYAVTAGKNDFTELGVFGVDTQGHLWEVDWWHEQSDVGKSTEQSIDMFSRWKASMWFNEGGVIDKAMGPLFNLRMRERQLFTDRRALPSMSDKLAKCQAFIARCNAGVVHFRDNANSRRIVQQIASLPAAGTTMQRTCVAWWAGRWTSSPSCVSTSRPRRRPRSSRSPPSGLLGSLQRPQTASIDATCRQPLESENAQLDGRQWKLRTAPDP